MSDMQCPHCPRNGFNGAHGLQVHIARSHRGAEQPALPPKPGGAQRPTQERVVAPLGPVHEHDEDGNWYEHPLILDEPTSARLELLCHATKRNAAEVMRDHIDAEYERLDIVGHLAREQQLAESARG